MDTLREINEQVKIGINLLDAGKYDQAERIFLSALEKATPLIGRDSIDYADLLKSLAILRFEQHKWQESIDLLKQIEAIFKAVQPLSEGRAMIQDYLIQASWLAGDFVNAERYAQEALILLKILKMQSHPKFFQITAMLLSIEARAVARYHPTLGSIPDLPRAKETQEKKKEAPPTKPSSSSSTLTKARSREEHIGMLPITLIILNP